MSDKIALRLGMSQVVSARWLRAQLRPEYRLTVYLLGKQGRVIPTMLRYFRDGKRKIGSVSPIRDMGIKTAFDSVTLWTQDYESLSKLAAWFEGHGYDTSGVS